MIPKIIHYCWFGKHEIPKHLKRCMDTWHEILPDYTIMRWDENNFDVESIEWTREAYKVKKYAFVSDYVRLVALERYGGIYLDTDVVTKKPFDALLCNQGFMGFENELYLTSAVMGFEPHHPLVTEFLRTYEGKHFILEAGALNNDANVKMMTEIGICHGLQINNEQQIVSNILILPREFFCPLDFYHNDRSTTDTMTVHYFDASWLDADTKKMITTERTLWHKLYVRLKGTLAALIKGRQ